MGKKLAIKGHSTRGKEVIELLKMIGGKNSSNAVGNNNETYYFIDGDGVIDYSIFIDEDANYVCFTLEEFLEKYPFKVGDKVEVCETGKVFTIDNMIWEDELCIVHDDMEYIEYYIVNELKLYKEINMKENKALFKTGDVVKLKGCSDENLFWIVMDVVKDGYIFNNGKKCLFDEQHHYEKSNREVMFTKTPEITTKVTIQNNSGIKCPDGYEFYDENGNLIGTKVMMKPIKPKYPTSYSDCCDILGFKNRNKTEQQFLNSFDLYDAELMTKLSMLKVCRDAYWKIAGEELELGKPWKPNFGKYIHYSINFYLYKDSFVLHKGEYHSPDNRILVFPIEEMRDAFYENFKDLIEYCKEML